jgi:response regulator RpfG family c-di-GMP phosphodiesterase
MLEKYSPNRKVLYVDDEPALLDSFKAMFRKEEVEVYTLQYPEMINKVINNYGPFAVVFSDERMPNLQGHQLLEIVKLNNLNTQRYLVTGFSSLEDTIKAINIGGIHRYIPKPWKEEEVKNLVKEGIDTFNIAEEKEYLINYLKEQNKL